MSQRELNGLSVTLCPADLKAIAAEFKKEIVEVTSDFKATCNDLRLTCDTLREQLTAVLQKVEDVRAELKEDVGALEAKVNSIEPVVRRVDDVEAQVAVLPDQISHVEEMVEALLFRTQVIVYGLPEEGDEGAKEIALRRAATESVASNFVENVMELEGHVPIEDAFRLGKAPGAEPRPMIIDFSSKRDAITVLQQKRKEGLLSKLRERGIKVFARQTAGVRERKKHLWNNPAFKAAADAAYRDGKKVSWSQDRPYIDGVLWSASSELPGPPAPGPPPPGPRAGAGGDRVAGHNGQDSGGRGGRRGGDWGGRGQGRRGHRARW